MAQTDFPAQIEDAWKRVARLREQAVSQEPAPDTYEELLTAYEELRVADEELAAQQDEIERGREATEIERVKYQDLFEFAPDAYLLTDESGVIQESNRAATQLLGVSRRFLAGKPLISFIAGDERRLFRELLSRLRRAPRVPDFTIQIRPRRAAPIDAALTVAAVRDRDGRLSGLRWMVRDISAQTSAQAEVRKLNEELWVVNKEIERSAAENLQQYRDIFQFAGQAIAVDGAAGVLQKVNPAFAKLHGYRLENMEGMPCLTVVPEHVQEYYVAQQRIAKDRGHHVFESVHRDRTNREFPVEVDTTVVRNAAGDVMYRIVSVTDITERKLAEEAVNAAYEREHKIAQALQRSLLVKPPPAAFPQMQIETFYEPAMNEALVGGDFFDALPLPGGQVALVVGDVAGKGLAAAEQMAAIKHLLRAFLWSTSDPSQAMALLNDFLCAAPRRGDDGLFSLVVVALAVLDPATGAGRYASGGADHALIVHPAQGGGEAWSERLDAEGLLLGVQPGTTFATSNFRLDRSDWLLMATDGVTEARQGNEFLGMDGLIRFAHGAAQLPNLRERGRQILGETRAFSAGALRDDVCLLLAQRAPAGG